MKLRVLTLKHKTQMIFRQMKMRILTSTHKTQLNFSPM